MVAQIFTKQIFIQSTAWWPLLKAYLKEVRSGRVSKSLLVKEYSNHDCWNVWRFPCSFSNNQIFVKYFPKYINSEIFVSRHYLMFPVAYPDNKINYSYSYYEKNWIITKRIRKLFNIWWFQASGRCSTK